MDIQYKRTNYDPTADILELVRKRLLTIGEKYLGAKKDLARAYVELGKAVGAQQTGDIWRAEINLDSEGQRFRSEAVRSKIGDAVNVAARELARELRIAKRKEAYSAKKRGAAIKSLLRGFGIQ